MVTDEHTVDVGQRAQPESILDHAADGSVGGMYAAERRPPDTRWTRVAAAGKRLVGELVHRAYDTAVEWAAIGPDTPRGRRFGAFGQGSVICFPPTTIMNERYIRIGAAR
jgi:hypothetical protein